MHLYDYVSCQNFIMVKIILATEEYDFVIYFSSEDYFRKSLFSITGYTKTKALRVS